mmetsp:Transcript_94249/g.211296  ORF Transcript_94249/g.211296 Transcript_94249/m.211296 type:complete len:341 (+) Transcript_94249:103-1125(+)
MYLIDIGNPLSLKRFVIVSFNQGPTSAKTLFPPASTLPLLWISVSPQPSATTMTAWPWVCMRASACARTFSRSISISGIKQMSTCRAARAAFMAMKPQCLPISFTRPMQLALQTASTYAESTAFTASVHAVSKPKVWSNMGTSLSIVFGTPTTAHSWPIAVMASKLCMAPLWVPSPPSTKYCRMFIFAMTLAISEWGGLPRSLTRTLPPFTWMSCTYSSVSSIHLASFTHPLKPPMMPYTFLTPYVCSIFTISRITLFKPGQRPPQVTIAAADSLGLKWIFRCGPHRCICKYTPGTSSPLCLQWKVCVVQLSDITTSGPKLSKAGLSMSLLAKESFNITH